MDEDFVRHDPPTWSFRLHPLKALRALLRVRHDPNDLVAPVDFFFAMGGHDDGRTYLRAHDSREGRRILSERPALPESLLDHEVLRGLPEGSLGRVYADHLEREGLDPREISRTTRAAYAPFPASADHDFVRIRTRDLHDLIHVLTGYGVDYLGEGAVVAFTYGNFRNRGYLMLALSNCLLMLAVGKLRAIRFTWDGYRRGRRAAFLWAARWESLLPLPLNEVRERLAIDAVDPYEPVGLEALFGPDAAVR